MEKEYQPKRSYLRVATACPEVRVADVDTNARNIQKLYERASLENVSLVTFPELSLTGYTLGDLVNQNSLLDRAESAVLELAEDTRHHSSAMVVGLPLRVGNGLYNCAAVLADGEIKGVVPKANLPTYNEFYEERWFNEWRGPNTTTKIGAQEVNFGNDCLFEIGGVRVGVEICEDLWVAQPPSGRLAESGALVIANPSASPEQIGKTDYRRRLVAMQSGRLVAAYLYAGSHTSESTAEIVMGGHQLIAVNGGLAAERKPFGTGDLVITDVDVEHLQFDRRRQHAAERIGPLVININAGRQQEDLKVHIDSNPFFPEESPAERFERLEMALNIQAHGLAMRMKSTRQEKVVLGLSGGLDSTLALLVALRAADILGLETSEMIHTITMPGPASSGETQQRARELAGQVNVRNTVIPIKDLAAAELAALGHDGVTQDVTYENVQARARTSILFNYGNLNKGLVLGTGDLSEIALGWSTYNGDQQSHYNVNASIPKTMVRHLVAHCAERPELKSAKESLEGVLATVVSPELTSSQEGSISQSTEELIGPYELHDFFLYHVVRWGDAPDKISYLAQKAFEGRYDQAEIKKWLGVFTSRFLWTQFKRDNMPNGPKVGSVSLSPRGDWRMPSDLYNSALWQ